MFQDAFCCAPVSIKKNVTPLFFLDFFFPPFCLIKTPFLADINLGTVPVFLPAQY